MSPLFIFGFRLVGDQLQQGLKVFNSGSYFADSEMQHLDLVIIYLFELNVIDEQLIANRKAREGFLVKGSLLQGYNSEVGVRCRILLLFCVQHLLIQVSGRNFTAD